MSPGEGRWQKSGVEKTNDIDGKLTGIRGEIFYVHSDNETVDLLLDTYEVYGMYTRSNLENADSENIELQMFKEDGKTRWWPFSGNTPLV